MDAALRSRFNADFTPERYRALLQTINETERWPADFRIAETPIFLTREFKRELVTAGQEILARLRTPEFAQHAADAIPPGLSVPNETAHPIFLQIDFAICEDGAGRLTPRLIELQGFPSLYAFQVFELRAMRAAYPAIPAAWTSFFGGLDEASYLALLRRVMLADADPENVVLLEIEPEQQKTRIDFACTETFLGVRPVCLTNIRQRGRQLFYERDGREVRVERIYNRVIFDELLRRPDLRFGFDFQADLDVTWVGHPNWYFRISKHTLPFLKSAHTAPAFFANEFPAESENLADYVLKPLFSFAGLGVEMDPSPARLAALEKPREWILQKKVAYADFLPTADGHRSKGEIRLMFLWPEGGEPRLANNLARLSQGRMMGVDFNRDKTWVGSSIALHDGSV
ncbi:MAG: hypothetical protein JO295_03885 [Verrucomicrobia bacterium]|nr:hypothetical protein [Verrucomicrobiota bacterium]